MMTQHHRINQVDLHYTQRAHALSRFEDPITGFSSKWKADEPPPKTKSPVIYAVSGSGF